MEVKMPDKKKNIKEKYITKQAKLIVHLSKDLHRQIRQLAFEKEISMSFLVRQALQHELKRFK